MRANHAVIDPIFIQYIITVAEGSLRAFEASDKRDSQQKCMLKQ
jgi:hypothetical protein